MAAGFDPYYKWLGIRPRDQPPNHYRLLGLEPFEDDFDVISAAADRQQNFLRNHQFGEHAANALRLMNDIGSARLCLLGRDSKRAYDAELVKQQEPALSPKADEDPPRFDASELPPNASELPIDVPELPPLVPASRPSAWIHPAAIGGCACVALALLGALLIRPRIPAATTDVQPVTATDQWKNEQPNPSAVEFVPPPPSVPVGAAIDLLAKIDPSRDVIDGDFTHETDGAMNAGGRGRCRIPFNFPEDYRVSMRIERADEVDGLLFVFPCAGRHALFGVDGGPGSETGIYVDHHDPSSNGTAHRGRVLTSGRAHNLDMTVHPRHITIECDGKVLVDWHGSPRRLTLSNGYRVPDTTAMVQMLAPVRIHKMELIPLSPEGDSRAPRATTTGNLLAKVELERDTVWGKWSLDQQGLHAPGNTSQARVQIGEPLPREYTLKLRVKRPVRTERGRTLVVGFPTGETTCQMVFDSGGCCGLDMIDDIRWDGSEARVVGERLPGGAEHDIAITVRQDRIGVRVDNAPLIDWQGDFSRLRVPGHWAIPDSRRLALGADCHWTILDASVGPPDDLPEIPGKLTQPVDVLKLVDVKRDAYWGEWVRDETHLQAPSVTDAARLALPVIVPDEYVLVLDVEQQFGESDDSLCIGLPVGPRFAQVLLDGWTSNISGMHLDGRHCDENSVTLQTRVFEPGRRRTVTCTVQRNSVKVDCDGRVLIDWRGDPRRLSTSTSTTLPLRGRPFLGCQKTGYVFSRIELRPCSAASTAFPAPPSPTEGNLLDSVDVARDAVRGPWTIVDGVLRSPTSAGARLDLPSNPPDRYVLSALVTRRAGKDSLYFDLLVGGHVGMASFDNFTCRFSGLETIDGLNVVENETRREGVALPLNQPVRIDCIVTPDSIRVLKDGVDYCSWKGDPRRLDEGPGLRQLPISAADRRRLAIGSWTTEWEIRQLTLTPGITPP